MKKKGMTLIEILVAMAISAIIFSIATGSAVLLLQTKERLKTASEIQKEIAFSFTRIGDKVKSESIGYNEYSSESGSVCQSQNPKNTKFLCTKKSNFIFKDENLYLDGQPLFSKTTKITNGIFSITPEKDPFLKENGTSFNREPMASITFEAESKLFPEIKFQMQTTFSSRDYK